MEQHVAVEHIQIQSSWCRLCFLVGKACQSYLIQCPHLTGQATEIQGSQPNLQSSVQRCLISQPCPPGPRAPKFPWSRGPAVAGSEYELAPCIQKAFSEACAVSVQQCIYRPGACITYKLHQGFSVTARCHPLSRICPLTEFPGEGQSPALLRSAPPWQGPGCLISLL